MDQVNVRVTRGFLAALHELMRRRRVHSKSEAIRLAVAEALEHDAMVREAPVFDSWIGLALVAPLNPNPRFQSDTDLWH